MRQSTCPGERPPALAMAPPSNTIEGFWLGLNNFLRPFRGVSTWCLDLYLAFYQGIHNFHRSLLLTRQSWAVADDVWPLSPAGGRRQSGTGASSADRRPCSRRCERRPPRGSPRIVR